MGIFSYIASKIAEPSVEQLPSYEQLTSVYYGNGGYYDNRGLPKPQPHSSQYKGNQGYFNRNYSNTDESHLAPHSMRLPLYS